MELSTEEQVVNILKDTPQNSGAPQMGECTISSAAALSLKCALIEKTDHVTNMREKQLSFKAHVHLTEPPPHWVMQGARATFLNQKLTHRGSACSTRAHCAQSPAGWLCWLWKIQVS